MAWVVSGLGTNVFSAPVSSNRRVGPKCVCFNAGQPLGYLSSWPLFALAHHFVVWYCAEKVYPGKVFRSPRWWYRYRGSGSREGLSWRHESSRGSNLFGENVDVGLWWTWVCEEISHSRQRLLCRWKWFGPLDSAWLLCLCWNQLDVLPFRSLWGLKGLATGGIRLRLRNKNLNITDTGIGTFWWPSRLVESYHYRFLSG